MMTTRGTMLTRLLLLLLLASVVVGAVSGLSSSGRAILVTGANKGQGLALCERILAEHDDTHVFLCSRDIDRGNEAASRLAAFLGRVDVIPLDVTDDSSVQAAAEQVQTILEKRKQTIKLYGLVSNAGILWSYPLSELLEVCTIGPKRVLDAFLPMMEPNNGRVVVVSSGLGPLMHDYASPENAEELKKGANWETIHAMMEKCLDVANAGGGPEAFENIGFSGGPFAESAPDFHMYGLAKMFADSYMLSLARTHQNLAINSCDPGLVYTDLIDRMPRYSGKSIEETNGAKTPAEGVEACMRLLFGGPEDGVNIEERGLFYAMNKEGKLMSSGIDTRPDI
jgi:NAD(P)-dependent dehydrogenase (short-subunit alcohol dehydrogenase family)